jgi:hypothetical protein
VPALDAQGLGVGTGGLEDPQPIQRPQGDQCVLGGLATPGGDQQRAELVAVQPCRVRLIVPAGAADMSGR